MERPGARISRRNTWNQHAMSLVDGEDPMIRSASVDLSRLRHIACFVEAQPGRLARVEPNLLKQVFIEVTNRSRENKENMRWPKANRCRTPF